MDQNRRMGIYTAVGLVLIIVIMIPIVMMLRKNAFENISAAHPTYTDESGEIYVAALLKEMSDDTITVDVVEFITADDVKRIKELNLTEDDMPDGYYILYNSETKTMTWKLDRQTVYTFIDWGCDFTGSDHPEEYTTTDVEEFKRYVGTYTDSLPGMPFFFQVEKGVVRLVLEKPIA